MRMRPCLVVATKLPTVESRGGDSPTGRLKIRDHIVATHSLTFFKMLGNPLVADGANSPIEVEDVHDAVLLEVRRPRHQHRVEMLNPRTQSTMGKVRRRNRRRRSRNGRRTKIVGEGKGWEEGRGGREGQRGRRSHGQLNRRENQKRNNYEK
eukprot:GHVU01026115.1.p3 GENE.GHVU01026115.1~~GHVU01026115.1.p3  ORF type:complete len:152 (-),score=12.38 GHVU01026115.1:571-1026(-)